MLNYESQLERDFLYLLDHDPNCIDIQTQPCHVHYKTKNNRKVKATPDVWAIFQDGRQFLFEVKPEKKLKELEKDENWQLKTKAIIQYCKNHRLDWEYRIITEKNIRGVRLNNIKDMLGAAKHYSPVKININIGNFDITLKALLQKSPTTFEDIINQLEDTISLKKSEIISLLKYKIYHNRIAFNWNVPFREAVLFISPAKNIYEKI